MYGGFDELPALSEEQRMGLDLLGSSFDISPIIRPSPLGTSQWNVRSEVRFEYYPPLTFSVLRIMMITWAPR